MRTTEVLIILQVEAAVTAASNAFKGPWGSFTGAQRSACLFKLADLIEKAIPEIAHIESLTMGTPISVQQHGFAPIMVRAIRYYAGLATSAQKGESFPAEEGSYRLVQWQPLGVCALVVAWNATLAFVGFKIGPCLAAGNTVVFKASEKSPLAILMLAPLFKEAGFPDGVVNFVSGTGATGDLLAHHMRIRKISFTGSMNVGRRVLKAAAESNLKRVTLELGGKSPALIFADADVQSAVLQIAKAILTLSGQVCVCTSRILVEESIVNEVVQGMKAFLEGARQIMGDPMKAETMLGPLVDKTQFDRVMSFIEQGKKEAKLITGGIQDGSEGFFVQPTLFLDPGEKATIYREEIFGPVMLIKTFKNEEEAIEMANDTEYGLFAAVFTKDTKKGLRVAGKVEAGTVLINQGFGFDMDTAFGGWKQSGIGLEGGEYGLKAFLQAKTVKISME